MFDLVSLELASVSLAMDVVRRCIIAFLLVMALARLSIYPSNCSIKSLEGGALSEKPTRPPAGVLSLLLCYHVGAIELGVIGGGKKLALMHAMDGIVVELPHRPGFGGLKELVSLLGDGVESPDSKDRF